MNKIKNKKILLIIGIVILVNLGLFIFFRSQDQTKIAPTTSDQQPVDQPVNQPSTQESAFSIEGVLVGDGQPWLVLYDDAQTGTVANTLELVFTDQSRCDFGEGGTSCTPMLFEVGTGIKATGQKNGSKLIVTQIDRAVNLMPPQ